LDDKFDHWKIRLIFYDSVGKTGGVAAKAFDHGMRVVETVVIVLLTRRSVHRTLHSAQEFVESCVCAAGCYKCMGRLYICLRSLSRFHRRPASVVQGEQHGLFQTWSTRYPSKHSWTAHRRGCNSDAGRVLRFRDRRGGSQRPSSRRWHNARTRQQLMSTQNK
jgi:hypothetical protein